MYGGFDVYKTYLAVKLHFTSDTYDYYKYGGKVNAKLETFTKRKDRYFFHKLSTKYAEADILDFFVANFLADSKRWIGNLLANDGRGLMFRALVICRETLSKLAMGTRALGCLTPCMAT